MFPVHVRASRSRCMVLAALLLLFAPALSARAGTICGTVTDEGTNQPIAGVAVLLYDAGGAYTGIHTGSAADGTWCLDGVDDGTYTLQFLRDDYRLAVVEGVVLETATSVDVQASGRVLFAAPWPNPTTDRIELRFRVPVGQPLVLELFDVAGRRVIAWSGVGDAGDRRLLFDLVDAGGEALASGVYHARLRSDGVDVLHRFTLVR